MKILIPRVTCRVAAVFVSLGLLLPGPLVAQTDDPGGGVRARGSAAADPGGIAPSTDTESEQLRRRIEALERAMDRAEEAIRVQHRLEAQIRELERELKGQEADAAELEQLRQRIRELETEKIAHEEATRTIIRQALSGLGSKINELVGFGGTLEVQGSTARGFAGRNRTERSLGLNTAEFAFEVELSEWVHGNLVLEYIDGGELAFVTSTDDEIPVDRINIDTAHFTFGDTRRFWPFFRAGTMVVPFGISTGDPVADVLTLDDPITVELSETRRKALLFGVEFPTPPVRPEMAVRSPPPVRPKLVGPLVGKISRWLGYKPWPVPPPVHGYFTPKPLPAALSVGAYTFQGETLVDTTEAGQWIPEDHYGVYGSYHFRGKWRSALGRDGGTRDEKLHWLRVFCPVSIDLGVNYTNSVFESQFLSFEYRTFLRQIGFVPGVAAHVKAAFGPLGLVGEWISAMDETTFRDDRGRFVTIQPSAWHASLGYQFGFNPSVESIGAQGTYVAVSYSESRDLAGVTRVANNEADRVGTVSQSRFLLTAGEWVQDGTRVALEYSLQEDYAKSAFGTGRFSNGITGMLTFDW